MPRALRAVAARPFVARGGDDAPAGPRFAFGVVPDVGPGPFDRFVVRLGAMALKFTLGRVRQRPDAPFPRAMTLALLVADGARPDTLFGAIDAGHLPALAALRAEGAAATLTSCFPSVTGPAYVPFLMGLHPGEAGVPGIRWWDRSGTRAYAAGQARSYVGFEALRQDGDLVRTHPTLFELAAHPLAAFTPIGRGLPPGARLGAGVAAWPRLAWTHFRGDVDGWLRIEQGLVDRIATRVAREPVDLAFIAHPGVDKLSHQRGHDAPAVLDALRIIDRTVARLRADAARDGRALDVMVVSDHGHAPVHAHEDLAGTVASLGHGVLAHPWTFAGGDDVAVMVGGNAMAHLYVELGRRARAWWPALARRWAPLAEALLARDAVDLLLLPHGPDRCELRARARGRALVERDRTGAFAYRTLDGDPLGLAGALGPSGAVERLGADEAHDLTRDTAYPDGIVQALLLAGAPRAGDLLVSAARGWDLRARWEPVPHRSTHGALLREQMQVPLLTSFPLDAAPRRTTECFALAARRLAR